MNNSTVNGANPSTQTKNSYSFSERISNQAQRFRKFVRGEKSGYKYGPRLNQPKLYFLEMLQYGVFAAIALWLLISFYSPIIAGAASKINGGTPEVLLAKWEGWASLIGIILALVLFITSIIIGFWPRHQLAPIQTPRKKN